MGKAKKPAAGSTTTPPPSISETLRAAIRDSGQSVNEFAKASGVPQSMLQRFVVAGLDIRLATAEKIAGYCGLVLGKGKVKLSGSAKESSNADDAENERWRKAAAEARKAMPRMGRRAAKRPRKPAAE